MTGLMGRADALWDMILEDANLGRVPPRIARPMSSITETMRHVADGNMACEIPFADRADEIGEFSRALAVFRRNANKKRRVEDELVHSRIAKQSAEASSRVKSEFGLTNLHGGTVRIDSTEHVGTVVTVALPALRQAAAAA